MRPSKQNSVTVFAFLLAFGSSTAKAADEAEHSKSDDKSAKSDDSPADDARTLFLEARELVKSGDFAKACPKFEASLKLKAGVGTKFNLADCWEKIGRTASARELFLRVAEAAREAKQ